MAVPSIRVEELLAQTHWVRGLARSLVQGDEAEDVAQETMISALQSPPPSDRPLRPWLARVAANVVRMNYRSNSRRQARELAFSNEVARAKRPDVVGRFELHNTVAELMVELPEPFRSTLLLRYFDDQSSTEIAASQNVAAGTVRWRIKRGLEMLRERLDEQSGDRKTWMLSLQPLIALPSKTAAATGGSAAAVVKGAIAMKLVKVAAVVVAVLGLSYGGYIATRSEGEPVATASERHSEDARPAKVTGERLEPNAVPDEQNAVSDEQERRPRLLAALAAARSRRLAKIAQAPAGPASATQSPHAQARPAGKLDKEYIRDQMQEILPLVRGCYERTLLRRPDLEGRAVVEFAIIGEEDVGGLIERSEFDAEASTIVDEEFSECIQETMYALEFEPPEGGGRIVVRYPFEFRADGPEE